MTANKKKRNFSTDVALKAVGQQSGIFTGDGGLDLTAGGKTTLIGGAITTTEAARNAGRNNYESLGGITTQDIENTTSYDGDALQVGVSVGNTTGKPQAQMNGIGYGSDGDSDSSVTRAGITGIAGNKDITTDNRAEYAGVLENSFDVNQVNKELDAQTQITQAFDQERRKIKTQINAKEQKLRKDAEEQGQLGNPIARDTLLQQADKVQNQGLLFDAISGAIYGPNSNGATGYAAKAASPFVANQIGTYFKANEVVNSIDGGDRSEQGSAAHILAHGILGAAVSYATGNDILTGGLSASSGELTAPILSKFLYDVDKPSELTPEQKDTISAITSAVGLTIGATTGSASDAANAAETSKVAVEDNYYYADLKNINKASKKQVERIYNIQKSSFEGKCRSAGGDCNDVIQKMINFVENPYVKSNYGDLRNQTIAKLASNPKLLITYFDSLAYKFNAKDRSILNRYIKPTLEAGGGAIGGVGSIGGAAYACGASAGIGCYAAVVAGSAGLSSSSDHLITGTKNFGKPLSQQDPTQIVQTLQGLGLSKEAAQTLQLGIDVLGTGGLGFGVGTVTKTGKYVPTAQFMDNLLPTNFNEYVLKHNTQLGVRNSSMGTISGSHQQDAFLESVDIIKGKVVGARASDSRYPGIYEYKYQIPTLSRSGIPTGSYKKIQTKTTYDPAVLSNQKVATMSNTAAKNANDFFVKNPTLRKTTVRVEGYLFEVTKDSKTGLINNAYLTLPGR